MQNADLGDVERDEALEALPGQARTLTTPSQSAHPSPADFGAEHSEPFQIAGHSVIERNPIKLHHSRMPQSNSRIRSA